VKVSLFVTCLVDQLRPEVGRGAVEVLRRAGCEVDFDPRQTCCGQPAWNSGHHGEARRLATRLLEVYGDHPADAVVLPSGSCTAMLRHLEEVLDAADPRRPQAVALAARTLELASFLVDVLGVVELGARFEGRLAWHDSCHGLRALGLAEQPRRLLEAVAGAELVEVEGHDTCCGFGGTFAVKHPELSVAMADWKIERLEEAGIDAVVGPDLSCLLQLGGRLERRGSRIRALHLTEVLAAR